MKALSVQAFANSLEKIYPVTLRMGDARNRIQLDLIEVHEQERGMGYGWEIMDLIIDYSELHRLPIELTPSPDFGGKLRKLKKFYKKLGFKKLKGYRLYDMIRYCDTENYYSVY
ncbi:MAG: hypothetical protein ACXAD7_13080 [Candidatus Kariarchaeaceae archaeon]|jgi:GNAT superfamily N-acetyltransferase